MTNERRKAAAKSLKAFFGNGPAEDLSPRIRAGIAKLEAMAKPRDTGVAGMLLAGRYRYVDFPGADAQTVTVAWENGVPLVRFEDMEAEDAQLELDARDMAGQFTKIP